MHVCQSYSKPKVGRFLRHSVYLRYFALWVYRQNNIVIILVAASSVTISSAGCTLKGQNVSLTCKVTYNGTNVMPMRMQWTRFTWRNRDGKYLQDHFQTVKAVNASSVYHYSQIYTTSGQQTESYVCYADFTRPTGLAISGVQRQYPYVASDVQWSPIHAPPTAASKAIIAFVTSFVWTLLIHFIIFNQIFMI